MTADRRQPLTVLPNGSIWNEQTWRDFIGEMERRAPKRATVERLSASDPVIQSGSKGRAKDFSGTVA